MSLVTNLQDLATRIATECKIIRALINNGAADLSDLTTGTHDSLVAAINELNGLIGGASATTLNDLTDVAIVTPLNGHIVRYNNGTGLWENVLGTTYFEVAGAAAAAQSASQPLDADLTAIAAVASQTAYGRAFLALANQAALVALLPSYQPLDADLTSIAALTTTAYGRGLLTVADVTAMTATLNAATTALPGIVELATTVEATTGTDTTRAVTAAGVKAVVDALVNAAPGTLDTLNELATAIGNDPNFATTLSTSLAGKQPLDTDLTAIAALVSAVDKLPYSTGAGTWSLATFTAAGRALVDDADVAAQRATLSVYSQTEIGDPTTDFVATFNTGLT